MILLAPFVLLGVAAVHAERSARWSPASCGGWSASACTSTGLSGTLSGPLRVERFELDHPRVHVVVHDIVIHPQLRGLLLQTMQASLGDRSRRGRDLRDAEMPPSTRPPRFLPQFLRVDARNVELTRVRYVHIERHGDRSATACAAA